MGTDGCSSPVSALLASPVAFPQAFGTMTGNSSCETCRLRARHDSAPRSLLGRLWRWHASWCPGWRKYITSLPDDRRRELAARYGMRKYAS